MNQSLFWVIVALCVAGILFGILRQIDWYEVFSKRWGNSPMRGRVYIHFGRDVVFEDAEYCYVDDVYVFFTYQYRKVHYAIAIKQEQLDQFGYIRGRIMIHAKFGEGVTVLDTELTNKKGNAIVAVVGTPEDIERKEGIATIGAVELNASLKSKTAVDLVNSIGNRGGIKIMTIVLIIAVVIGGFLFFKMYQDNKAKDQQQQQQQQIDKNPNSGIENQLQNEGALK
jgi:hypothetical protein